MSGGRGFGGCAGLVVALIGLCATESRAQSVPLDEAPNARAEKARALTPPKRSTIERLIFKLDDELLLERLLDAPRGIYLRLGKLGEGAGFAAGPAFRHNAARFDFKTSAATSMKKYFIGEASLRFPGTVGHNEYVTPNGPYVEIYARRRDFPQEDFFGLGPDSLEMDRSNFAVRDTYGRLTTGFESRRLHGGVALGYLDVSAGPGADMRMPSATDRFSPAAMPGIADRPAFLVIEPFIELVTMDRARNDRSGVVYRLSAAQYRDRELDRYSFLRWEADLRHYLTFVKDSRMIALRALAISTNPDSGNTVPFYLQPTLGGARTLRGYRTFRFRDQSTLLLQAEYRWRINEFVTGALFYDTGAVGSTLEDLGRFERNYGFGFRAGNRMGSAFRLDFAFGGREGHRILVRFDDVF
jgi:hypothetical protein